MKKCQGCGLTLQNTHKDQPGYAVNLDHEYCQSCFRLQHYGDTSRVNQKLIDSEKALNLLKTDKKTLYVWVLDLFHLVESDIKELDGIVKDSPILIVLTKRELYPKTYSDDKIIETINELLKDHKLNVIDIIVTANFGQYGAIEVLNSIKKHQQDQVIVIGKTNVGKSTLLNQLSDGEFALTTSEIPGTTQQLVHIKSEIDNLYDSPGIPDQDDLYQYLDIKTIKTLQPKSIKPRTFQLSGHQALYLKNYGYFVFNIKDNYSITTYFPESVEIVRINPNRVFNQFTKNDTIFDSPLTQIKLPKQLKGKEIVIHQVGFLVIHDIVLCEAAKFHSQIKFTVRKARI